MKGYAVRGVVRACKEGFVKNIKCIVLAHCAEFMLRLYDLVGTRSKPLLENYALNVAVRCAY